MNLPFLIFVVVMAAVVTGLNGRYRGTRSAMVTAAALAVWLTYIGLIGYFGIVRDVASRPPGPVFLFVPVVIFLGIFVYQTVFHPKGNALIAWPLGVVLLVQSFRVIVELFIHQLWVGGLVPEMLTYLGANVDIYIGATAPLVALCSTRWRWGKPLSVIWNVLGLLALANVVIRAILTAPGPLNLIHAEVPNLMIGTFPYLLIPGFFVPLAVAMHVSALRISLGKDH